jgi:hypothetical protein
MSNISSLRQEQWQVYATSYTDLLTKINHLQTKKEDSLEVVSLNDLAKEYNVDDIYEKISVDNKTFVAEICCVDEGTQRGDFVQEQDLEGHNLGTIGDPNSKKYLIDIPGSGALKLDCPQLHDCKNKVEDVLALEDTRLTELAEKTVAWCKKKEIVKFTVTYHCNCGAIKLRKTNFPEICSDNDLDEAKNCALKLARKIDLEARKIDYKLNVTTAYIGDKQMCNFRPSSMHNAIGTIANLDDKILAAKVDDVLGLNFFDVFVDSNFETKDEDYKESISDSASDILLTYKIATGSHGWGLEHFSAKNPYLIMFFANNAAQLQQAEEVAQIINKQIDYPEKIKMLAVEC